MKNLLLIFLLITGTVMAQSCPPEPCTPNQFTQMQFGTTQNFTGSQCLKGKGVVDSAVFLNYSYLSFKDSLIIKVPLDFTTGVKQLFLHEYVYIENIRLDGNDTIYDVAGFNVIKNVSFSAPGSTILYITPGNPIWIDGQYYTAGMEYVNGGGKISLVACGGGTLALRPVTKPVFHPAIEYHFIVTDFYTGKQYRKTCTYPTLIKSLPFSIAVVEAGGLRQITHKIP